RASARAIFCGVEFKTQILVEPLSAISLAHPNAHMVDVSNREHGTPFLSICSGDRRCDDARILVAMIAFEAGSAALGQRQTRRGIKVTDRSLARALVPVNVEGAERGEELNARIVLKMIAHPPSERAPIGRLFEMFDVRGDDDCGGCAHEAFAV